MSADKTMTASVKRHPRDPLVASAGPPAEALASVYVDCLVDVQSVRTAVAKLPIPLRVSRIHIDDRSMSATFGCRIAIELTGTFGQATEGPGIARQYAQQLSVVLGAPAFALHDLLRADPARFLH